MLLWVVVLTQLVVKEAAEKLDVALLRVDGQSLQVLGTRLIVVRDGLIVRLKHAKEHEQRANHHACAAFACLAMDDDDRLLCLGLLHVALLLNFVVLLHALQEESGVHAVSEHFLQVRHIMVQEWELAD